MRRSTLLAGTLLLALTACGGRENLQPAEGQRIPPKPRGAAEAPTAQELMTPSTQSRPLRNAELLRQSQKRTDDPFDLPPEDN
jgi:hypothetical protein